MSGVDTAYAAGFVDSDVARVNSPPFLAVTHFFEVMDQSHRTLQSNGPAAHVARCVQPPVRAGSMPDCPFANRSPGLFRLFWLFFAAK